MEQHLGYILYSFSYVPSLFFLHLLIVYLCWLWKPIINAVIDTKSPLSTKFFVVVIILQAPRSDLCFEVPIPLCHSSLPLDVYPQSYNLKSPPPPSYSTPSLLLHIPLSSHSISLIAVAGFAWTPTSFGVS